MKLTRILILFLISLIFANFVSAQEKNINSQPKVENIQKFISTGAINPEEYFVGPGDVFNVSIIGIDNKSFILRVNHEGQILLPEIGLISLKGKSLKTSKDVIKEQILDHFKNVKVQISLSEVREIRVSVLGAVSTPMSINIKANYRLFDVISKYVDKSVPTINKNELDLRNVIVKDIENKENSYDLISFIHVGDRCQNPYLKEGDLIIVSTIDKTISIFGPVKFPGIYAYRKNESLKNLLLVVGGLLEKANHDSLEVFSYLNDNETLVSKAYHFNELNSKQLLKSGDKIVVREINDYKINQTVYIEGFVKRPGIYRITENQTKLKDLILNKAGGFLEKASLKDAYILRTTDKDEIDNEFERLKNISPKDMTETEYEYFKAKSRFRNGKMVIDFEKLFYENDEKENLVLRKGDEIYIPEKIDFVSVIGQAVKPGNIIYNKTFSVNDYINLAGGFGFRAEDDEVRVIKSSTGEWLYPDEITNLEPGDKIWIPEKPEPEKFWDITKDILTIFGQIATVITAIAAIIVATR